VTLFRQVGGCMGVALFGAIFSNELTANLRRALPGVHASGRLNVAEIRHLPPSAHDGYVHALTDALHPVFLAAAGVCAIAFVLAGLLPEVPLRTTAGAPSRAPATSPLGTPAPSASSGGPFRCSAAAGSAGRRGRAPSRSSCRRGLSRSRCAQLRELVADWEPGPP
jgi:hypothetical protein